MRWLKNTPIAHVAQFLLAYARKASVRMPAVHGLYSIGKWEHEFYTNVLNTLIISRTFRLRMCIYICYYVCVYFSDYIYLLRLDHVVVASVHGLNGLVLYIYLLGSRECASEMKMV